MSPPLNNYLRTHRKTVGLSQKDVAFLLGKESGSCISKFEQSKTHPNLRTTLSYQIFFETPVEELFAGVHNQVELQTLNRIAKLITLLERKGNSPKILRRIRYLEEMARRIAKSNKQES